MKAFIVILVSIIVSGCSGGPSYGTAYNGLMYYFPEDCDTYKYLHEKPNELWCRKDGKPTGKAIYPMTQRQVSNYKAKAAQDRLDRIAVVDSLNELSRSIKESTPTTFRTNCNTYGYGNISCTSTGN